MTVAPLVSLRTWRPITAPVGASASSRIPWDTRTHALARVDGRHTVPGPLVRNQAVPADLARERMVEGAFCTFRDANAASVAEVFIYVYDFSFYHVDFSV